MDENRKQLLNELTEIGIQIKNLKRKIGKTPERHERQRLALNAKQEAELATLNAELEELEATSLHKGRVFSGAIKEDN